MYQNAQGNESISSFTHPVFTKAEDITTKVLYIIIAVVNFAGNATLVYIISKRKRIQNTVNLLLLNLSIADIVTGIAIFPYLFLESHSDLSCGIKEGMPFFHAASMANFLTLAFLSFSRYLLINHATRPNWRIRKPTVKWLAMTSWIVGFLVTIPNIVYSKYNSKKMICEDLWLNGLFVKVTFISTFIISVTALFAMFFTYFATVYTLWFKASTQRLRRSNSTTTVQSSRKRITLLLGMLIVTFMICWLPFTIYMILSAGVHYFPDTVEDNAKKTRIKRFTVLIAFLNTCFDPVFYAFGNRQIREEAVKTFSRARSSNAEATMIELE